ncbi:stalk domain-containing protein [Paenibacillus sp. DMB20]|uniref:stalk domain-containing protein n=1 Tax=Paenibacillus sp. DMB20 TaxID=1642570 RepID=UPI00062820C0|nr:extracellular solute-binding protein [Paenibacillus sp. DMB20]KKO52822.1 hypothetical protein XI25_16330 [Paenibacillus sp. DMB20]
MLHGTRKRKKLTAEHTGKASLAFSDKRAEAVLGDRTVHALPSAPFVLQGQLWIPLRWTAESCGFVVTWNASGSFVTVRDPDARFHLRVGTRAENGITEQPSGLIQYIKADWNTDVQIDLVVPQNFSDKTKIKIAAGDMDTLMLLPDAHEFQDDLLQSIALDLSKSLESAPTLKKLANDPDLPVRKISGKTYAIPRPSDLNDAPFPALRQDWMDKLGSKKPETMDEMFDVLRQFVNKDPDGDGKNNTIGMYGYVNANNLGSLSWVEHAYTGFPERFGISESGTVVDHALGKGQRQALEWLGRANAAGLLNKDFATVDRETAVDAVKKGKTGLAVLKFDDAAKMTLDNMGHWTPVSGLRAGAGATEIAPWNSAGGGVYIVSSMSKAEPAKALEWLNRGMEMTETGAWNNVDGLDAADRSAIENLFGRKNLLTSNPRLEALAPETRVLYEQAAQRWHKTSYKGQTLPEASSLWSRGLHAESINKLNEMKVKVIMGKASLKEWDEYVKKMAASDEYKSMIKDLNKLVRTK